MTQQLLSTLRNGHLEHEVDAAIADIIASVRTYRAPGRLTISLQFSPVDDQLAVDVTDQVVVVLPKPPRATTTVFVDGDQISSNDPRPKPKR